MPNIEKRPLKVFLCHAHSDAASGHALYLRLRREGVDVWLAKEKLLPGSDWKAAKLSTGDKLQKIPCGIDRI